MDNKENRQAGREEFNNSRTSHKKRNFFVAVLLTLVVLTAIVWSPMFALKQVEIKGQTSLTEDEIFRIMGVYRGESLVLIQPDESARLLMQDLRIAQASVQRVFPAGLVVQLRERVPVAVVACDYGYLGIDEEGRVVSAGRIWKTQDVPFIAGREYHDLYIGDVLQDDELKGLLYYLAQLDTEQRTRLDKVSIDSDGYATAYVVGSVEIRIGKLERLDEKVRLTQDFLAELKTAKHPIEYIDLNFTSPFIKFR